jgi:hypothetical protein
LPILLKPKKLRHVAGVFSYYASFFKIFIG